MLELCLRDARYRCVTLLLRALLPLLELPARHARAMRARYGADARWSACAKHASASAARRRYGAGYARLPFDVAFFQRRHTRYARDALLILMVFISDVDYFSPRPATPLRYAMLPFCCCHGLPLMPAADYLLSLYAADTLRAIPET